MTAFPNSERKGAYKVILSILMKIVLILTRVFVHQWIGYALEISDDTGIVTQVYGNSAISLKFWGDVYTAKVRIQLINYPLCLIIFIPFASIKFKFGSMRVR